MKNNKQRLFEVMGKVDKTFKPKLNENIDEISTGLANDAATNAVGDVFKTYAAQPHDADAHQKALSQTSTFREYVNPKLKQYLESKGFQVEKTINGSIELTINDITIYISPDSFEFGKGFTSSMLPPEIQTELPKIIQNVQADLNKEKGEFNPASPQQVNERGQAINPKYTHFAVTKDTNQILNGWDYSGIEPVELRQFKKDYFFDDLTNMGIDPHNVKVVTMKYLQSSGTNPFDINNWNQTTNEAVVTENRDGFKRMIVFWMYDKEGGYLGDLDPMDDEGYISNFDEIAATPEFQKFAKEKNITRDQIGRVTKSREYMMNGEYLEKQYYAPSDSEELFDPKTNTWYNLSGQQMRDPSEYDRGGEGYTPFGDEGDY